MEKRIKALWFPGWFPSRVDFLPGDFISRHAVAVSQIDDITILFVVKDKKLKPGSFEFEIKHEYGLHVYHAYYNNKPLPGIIGKIVSTLQHYRLLRQLIKKAQEELGSYDLVHIHIVLKQAVVARKFAEEMKLPLVVTEQNSMFMPEAADTFDGSNWLQRIIKETFLSASAVHVVSQALGQALTKLYGIKEYRVIPNVVDTELFYPKVKSNPEPLFFAVNGNVKHKNTDGVIRAFRLLIESGLQAKLCIAGPVEKEIKKMAEGLPVIFTGPALYKKIASWMRRADAFIFFTRYETFGCVAAESLCSGTPVIASDLPVLHENLDDANAIFVQSENEEALMLAMKSVCEQRSTFKSLEIAEDARLKYNYKKVGAALHQFYEDVLKDNDGR